MGMGLGSVNPAGRTDQKYLCTFDSSTPHIGAEQNVTTSCALVGVGQRRRQEGEMIFTG